MAKPNGATVESGNKSEAPAEQLADSHSTQWGTWEELLLACAVNRYGTNSWDAVATEIQKRSSSPSLSSSFLTPRNCQIKYLDLTRRFLIKREDPRSTNCICKNDEAPDDDDRSIITADESVPLLEELRKLRVVELRRELERYDLSILTLQSKVKELKDERQRSSSLGEDTEDKSSDLRKSEEAETLPPERDAAVDKIEVLKDEAVKSPSLADGDSALPAVSKDEQSVNESVQKDIKGEGLETGREEGKPKEPGGTGEGNEEPVRTVENKPVKEENSGYGSSDSVEKEYREAAVKVEPESVSHSPELVESVAESKDGVGGGEEEATTKECNSDVQSSATKSRRDVENEDVLRGSSNDGDLQKNNGSASVQLEDPVESQPLIDFLENVKGLKLGSLFLRRLDSQEEPKYKSLIRQHVDLEIVHKRVKEGIYSDSNLRFFRDLLLLVNNAMIFFSKNTPEFLAAVEIRHLIANEMAQRNAKSDSEKQASLEKLSLSKRGSSEPSEPLLRKPTLGGPLIVCRKRSSIAAKASGSSSGSDKKRDQNTMPAQESAGPDTNHPPPQHPDKAEVPKIKKKRSRDRFASVSATLKKSSTKDTDSNSKQTSSGAKLEKNKGKGGSSSQQPDPRCESKSNQSCADLKESAAKFLNRMKQSSSSKNSDLLDVLKVSPLSASSNSRKGSDPKKNENGKGSGGPDLKKNEHGKGSGGSDLKKNEHGRGSGGSNLKKNEHGNETGGSEHKKKEPGKGFGASEHKKNEKEESSGKKEQVSTRSSDAKQGKKKDSPGKKSLGRPLKKAAAPPTPSGKRGRDDRESETAASKQQRKKPRK